MGKLSRSWDLFKSSWSIIHRDRELLALPLISGAATILVMISFAVPGFLSLETVETTQSVSSQFPSDATFAGTSTSLSPTVLTYVIGAAFYFVTAFVVIFFNAALIHGANERFEGGDPTISSALAGAWSRVGLIAQWAAVSATVSMIIRQIQDRGMIGRLIGGFIGFAWAVVSYLVLPALVIEGIGVKDAFTRSKDSVRATWGENLIGQAGLGLIGLLGAIPGIALLVGGLFILPTSAVAGIAVCIVGILTFLTAVLVTSALGTVYQTALFRFASHRPVQGFSHEALAGAYAPKQAGRFRR